LNSREEEKDLEVARERANNVPRFRGAKLIPARSEWRRRRGVTAGGRRTFLNVVERRLAELRDKDASPYRHRARIKRRGIQDALIELGILQVRCRWVRARLRGPSKYPSYR
jgi:hypothetical protein